MEHTLTARRFLAAVVALALVTASVGAWIALRLGGPTVTLWIDDGVTPLAALTACVLCFRAGARDQGRMRLFWLLLACATALWTLAELIWGYYALILDVEVPAVSWADVGYLSAIPVTVAALVAHPATGGGRTRKTRAIFDGLLVATALLFLSWTLVLGPLWRSADLSTWAGVVALAYPFGDIVIVFFIVLAIRGMTGAERLSLWCLLCALLVMALTDSTYTYLTEIGKYSSGDPLDTGWIAAYLGIALAAFSSRRSVAAVPSRGQARVSLASLVAPLLPVLLALSVAAVQIRLGHHLDRAAGVVAVTLIALVLARQGLMLLELLSRSGSGRGGLVARLTDAALGVGAGPSAGSGNPAGP